MRNAPGASEWNYVPALDGIRALAIIAVILFHAGVPGADGGFLGVDLFFALSGWLITTLLLNEARDSRTIDLIAFWGRRMRRLLPAVLVVIVIAVLWAWLAGAPDEGWAVLGDAPWAQFYLANWHEISLSGDYWASFDAPAPLDHLWSLAIEEQFYIVWPVVVLVAMRVRRRGEQTLLALCAVGIVASFLTLRSHNTPQGLMRAYMGTDTRAAALLLGAALATSPARRIVTTTARSLGRYVDVVLVCCVVVLVVYWVDAGKDSVRGLLNGGLLAHSAVSAMFVAVAAATNSGWVVGALGRPVMLWIGQRSYGLYLWHWPIFTWLSTDRTGIDGVALFGIRLAITVAITELSYRFIEAPVRWRATWARGRDGWLVLGGSMAAVALFVVAIPRPMESSAAPPDVDARIEAFVAEAEASAAARPGDKTSVDPAAASPAGLSPATRPPIDGVVLLGDSVAYDLQPALEAAFESAGLDAHLFAFPGVSLTGGTWLHNDEQWLDDHFPALLAGAEGEVVMWMLSRWDMGKPYDELYDAHRRFAELALHDHEHVLFLTELPGRHSSEAERWAVVEEAARAVAAKDPEHVAVIDSDRALGGVYHRYDDRGDALRKPDGVHVCPFGAAVYSTFLLHELGARFDGVTQTKPSAWIGQWWNDSRYLKPPGGCVER